VALLKKPVETASYCQLWRVRLMSLKCVAGTPRARLWETALRADWPLLSTQWQCQISPNSIPVRWTKWLGCEVNFYIGDDFIAVTEVDSKEQEIFWRDLTFPTVRFSTYDTCPCNMNESLCVQNKIYQIRITFFFSVRS
jgi:hypothetical protein